MEPSIVTQLSDAVKIKLNKLMSSSKRNSQTVTTVDPTIIKLLADAIKMNLIKILPLKNTESENKLTSETNIGQPTKIKNTDNINIKLLSEELKTNLQTMYSKNMEEKIKQDSINEEPKKNMNLSSSGNIVSLTDATKRGLIKQFSLKNTALENKKISETNIGQPVKNTDEKNNVLDIKLLSEELKTNLLTIYLKNKNIVEGNVKKESVNEDKDNVLLSAEPKENLNLSSSGNIVSLTDEIKKNLVKLISSTPRDNTPPYNQVFSDVQSSQTTEQNDDVQSSQTNDRNKPINILPLTEEIKKKLLLIGKKTERIKKKVLLNTPSNTSTKNILQESTTITELNEKNNTQDPNEDPNKYSSTNPAQNVIMKTNKNKITPNKKSTGVFIVINSTLNEPTNIDYGFPV